MDADRVAGERRDDSERFDRLYRRHADPIFRFCLRRTGDWALAEDIRSAVFYEAWRRRADVDLETRAALPWLYGVAANVIRNHARSARRRAAAMRRVPWERAEADLTEDIAERIDASDRASAARDLMSRLPAGEREVVILCLAEDLSYSAAASVLGLPIGTVRSRLSRARARLSDPSLVGCRPS
jgi:RNA polymerase sigma-70 factor (ECF subfamily)